MLKRVGLILKSACGGRFVATLRAMLRFLRLLPDLGWNIGAIRVEFLTDQLRLGVVFLCSVAEVPPATMCIRQQYVRPSIGIPRLQCPIFQTGSCSSNC